MWTFLPPCCVVRCLNWLHKQCWVCKLERINCHPWQNNVARWSQPPWSCWAYKWRRVAKENRTMLGPGYKRMKRGSAQAPLPSFVEASATNVAEPWLSWSKLLSIFSAAINYANKLLYLIACQPGLLISSSVRMHAPSTCRLSAPHSYTLLFARNWAFA